MKRKRVYRVVLFIIVLLVVSCQVEPDMAEIVEVVEEITEETVPEVIVIPVDEPEIIIDDPIIEDPIMETIKMEYINDVDYHFPDMLKDKSIDVNGRIYKFSSIGIDLPTTMMLYPNPVNTWMFINAVEGQTTENVETAKTDGVIVGFSYAIHMTGKFEYKGNLYYGEVKIIVVYLNNVLTLNGLEGEFVE